MEYLWSEVCRSEEVFELVIIFFDRKYLYGRVGDVPTIFISLEAFQGHFDGLLIPPRI